MRQVTHALLTRPPLSHQSVRKLHGASFDLHVLGTPPAFILSQDQTLMLKFVSQSYRKTSTGPFSARFRENLRLASFKPFYCCFRFCSECSHSMVQTRTIFNKNFQGFTYCSVFKVLCCCLIGSSFTISQLPDLVNNFFSSFFEVFRLRFLETQKEGFEPSRRY